MMYANVLYEMTFSNRDTSMNLFQWKEDNRKPVTENMTTCRHLTKFSNRRNKIIILIKKQLFKKVHRFNSVSIVFEGQELI